MATAEERRKILRLVEEGKITAGEAARLLKAIGKQEEKRAPQPGREPGWLRVQVTDMRTGKRSVNVNVPLRLVDVGLRMGARFVPDMEGIEVEELVEALKQGMTGKVIDVVDEAEGQRVEIYVE